MGQGLKMGEFSGTGLYREQLTSAQLTMMLPAQSDIRALMDRLGYKEGDFNPIIEKAVFQIMADIVASPTNHNAWRDLSHVFGAMPMMQWKFLYVANRLQPDDFKIQSDLAFSYLMLGDTEEAFGLLERAIACADNENDRTEGCDLFYAWKYPEWMQPPTLMRM